MEDRDGIGIAKNKRRGLLAGEGKRKREKGVLVTHTPNKSDKKRKGKK